MKRIAVFGYSVMSLETMARLNPERCSILFIAKDDAEAALIAEKGFDAQVIDFRNDDALRSIGIGSDVDTLFCFYPRDSENVFLTISARAIDKNITIVAIVDDPESAEKLLAAGANKIIDPYEICGRKTHEMLTKPDITNILDNTVFGRHDLNMAQIEIPKGSCLENTKTSDLKKNQKHNLILIGVVDKELDDQLHFAIGEKEHRLDAGDILVVMGPAREIKAFKKEVEQC
ncbi:potassium channel family protein [Candidatus Methylobacter oryzae]|uniref:TrkA family potassium uptake protein n=1 Tax=Candidatus Methylobacter oryzae TaxID=2497749 RepID=A0ABY3C733_9GAMM|nr:NAD-binding protein [Candidatus Methylobacter oryzae]TRW91431.1 TrkA family potassium uptake protein [Candidatus Methylobacter oryzae]